MKITFFWNLLNNHQVWVADELYKILGDDFKFVMTSPKSYSDLKGGDDYTSRTYCIDSSRSTENQKLAVTLATDADVCVFGACSQEYAIIRAKKNPMGISFECSERWLKKGLLNIFSPNLIRWWLNYKRYYRRANFFRLCSSAYTKRDDELLGCYKDRHFKWGYFTRFEDQIPEMIQRESVKIIWCARFINWKNPEVVVQLGRNLKRKKIRFVIDMYGDGPLKDEVINQIKHEGVEDVIIVHGNKPNKEILKSMRNHDIFILTSNMREGWGAVLGEAMGKGCCPVASVECGAVPYLIENGENGFSYVNFEDLENKVEWLIRHTEERNHMRIKSYETIKQIWNPLTAAKNLLMLSSLIESGCESAIEFGPCSKS